MANLIFPKGTSFDGEALLLKVQLAGSISFYYVYISVDKTYACYVATHVTWISIYSPFAKLGNCQDLFLELVVSRALL